MTDGWQPLSVRMGLGDGPAEALVEGVPSWLERSLREWVRARLSVNGHLTNHRVTRVERTLRLSLDWTYGLPSAANQLLAKISDTNAQTALDVIDCQLNALTENEPNSAMALERILVEGGSAWTVGEANGRSALQRRVAEEAVGALTAASRVGRAGEHLKRAWASAFGREPNPSQAYREAVKAVEAALKPIVSPENERATLGTMIADLRNAPQKWSIGLGAQESFDSVGAFRSMLELLWKAQHDRHGTDDQSVPLDIDQPAAEAAVHLAVTVVLWCERSVITRVSG